MFELWHSRRGMLGLIAIGCLTMLGLVRDFDVSMSIVAVVGAVAVTNTTDKMKIGQPKESSSEQK